MKTWSRKKIMQRLQEIIPEITFSKNSDENTEEIWTSGETDWIYKGIPPFNYNLEYGEILLSENGDRNPKHQSMKVKQMYVNGIHREIYNWLEERGWYPKWYDAGTLFFWRSDKI